MIVGLEAVAGIVVASLAAGFGVGRIKSVKTASAIKAELDNVGDSALAEVKALAADVRKHL